MRGDNPVLMTMELVLEVVECFCVVGWAKRMRGAHLSGFVSEWWARFAHPGVPQSLT
jgi:hypothetical protein